MSLNPINYYELKEKIYRKSNEELDLMIEEAQLKMQESHNDEVAYKIAKLDLVIIQMSIMCSKNQDFDWKFFEEIYQELCEQPWEKDDEPSFPINYKAELLFYFYSEFANNFSYTRVERIQSLLKGLHERNPENSFVALKYISIIYEGFYDGIPYLGLNPASYFSKAEEIQNKYEYSKEDLLLLEFTRLNSLNAFNRITSFKEFWEINKRIIEIWKEMKSIFIASFIMK